MSMSARLKIWDPFCMPKISLGFVLIQLYVEENTIYRCRPLRCSIVCTLWDKNIITVHK